jgi:hypothetical protein
MNLNPLAPAEVKNRWILHHSFKVKDNSFIIFTMINGFFMCNLPNTNRCHQYFYRESESPPQTRLIDLFILDGFSFIGFSPRRLWHTHNMAPFYSLLNLLGGGWEGFHPFRMKKLRQTIEHSALFCTCAADMKVAIVYDPKSFWNGFNRFIPGIVLKQPY